MLTLLLLAVSRRTLLRYYTFDLCTLSSFLLLYVRVGMAFHDDNIMIVVITYVPLSFLFMALSCLLAMPFKTASSSRGCLLGERLHLKCCLETRLRKNKRPLFLVFSSSSLFMHAIEGGGEKLAAAFLLSPT